MCLFTGTLYGIYERKEKPTRISKCRATFDMVSMWYLLRWHHRPDRHGFEQAPGVGDGVAACHAADYGVTKSRTQRSNWTELNCVYILAENSWKI